MKRFLIMCVCLAMPAAAGAQQEPRWREKTARQWAAQLADEDHRVRWYATYALGQLGPAAAVAVEPLTKILENKWGHEYVRGGAAWALGRIGPDANQAVELLSENLLSAHMSVRRNAPKALGNIGAAARPAVPKLLERLEDEDATVRVNTAVALWKIDRHARAIPALVQMTLRRQGPGPYLATVGLGQLAAEPEVVAPPLAAALRHPDKNVHHAAARALGRIGLAARPWLKQALADPDPEVCRGAVEALGWIGAAAVPELIDALKSDSTLARRTAARALGRLGSAARSAEAALIAAVTDPEAQVRQAAARARYLIQTAIEREKTPQQVPE